jgi:3-oxoacyl-[acyl-carrier protein] reductase
MSDTASPLPSAHQAKVAIVTGASRGIGQATALRLAAGGAKLVITARAEESLAETREMIEAAGGEALCVATPGGEAERVVEAALARFGAIDILINNAGTTKTGDFLTLTDEDWADGYGTKVFAAMRLCRAAWPHLKVARGSVINIAGAGGRTPDQFFTIGGSVNAAVIAFSKALAQLGIEDGVQVNCINPGLIKTGRLTRRIGEAAERWNLTVAEAEARMLLEHKIARFGLPEEIAELIAYITGPHGKLIQATAIDADAGFTKGI